MTKDTTFEIQGTPRDVTAVLPLLDIINPNTCQHVWKEMRWQDAYPAHSGQQCTKCAKYELRW
jgi:hypothetical protein